MQRSTVKCATYGLAGKASDAAFFGLIYIFLWRCVDLPLIYHGGGQVVDFPVFYTGWTFFEEFLNRPGGPIQYISAVLSQLFNVGWLGAAVVTGQAVVLCLLVRSVLRKVKCRMAGILGLVPSILIIVPYCRYAYQFTYVMVVITATAAALVYMSLPTEKWYSRWAAFAALAVAVYALAGGAYLPLTLLCAIYELLFARRARNALLCLVTAAVLPYAGAAAYSVSLLDTFGNLLPFHWRTRHYEHRVSIMAIVYAVYLLVPAIMLTLGLWRLVRSAKPAVTTDDAAEATACESPSAWRTSAISAAALILPFAIAGAIFFFSWDRGKKTLLSVDYLARNQIWDELYAVAARNPRDYFVNHAVDRALYHQGRLAADLFAWPQNPQSLLLTIKETSFSHWNRFDVYLELGQLNLAEHSLLQSIEIFGERPLLLRRLAIVNMAKGNIGTARVYLGALSRTLFDGPWADGYIRKIRDDPNLSQDADVQHLRQVMVEKDRIFEQININLFTDLLDKNPRNRMAFEYLMTHCLLTVRLDEFVRNLSRLDDLDYESLPRSWEEAILLYGATSKKSVDLHGRQLSAETIQRFEKFRQIYLGIYRGNKTQAFPELAQQFGDSFLFYAVYGISGAKPR